MALRGKGWFIWQVARCEGGQPEAIADRAAAAGLSHVLLKVAERTFAFGFDRHGRDLVAPVARALRERGLQVWGWHYVYGDKPEAEARIAVKRSTELELDGYVVDAEAEYRNPAKAGAARTFMADLRAGLPATTLVAVSSYRYPSLHTGLPWQVFLEACDLAMPQVYWEKAHNSGQQLARAVAEYSNAGLVGAVRPVVPTGSAYAAGNWRPTPEDVRKFLTKARELGLAAANFYSWDYSGAADQADLWDEVARFDWPPDRVEPPAPDVVTRFVEALNARDLETLLDLYHDNAGHVTAERTILGRQAVAAWYEDLLANKLPQATFEVVETAGSGNSRHFRWKATSPVGAVVDGDDTLGLLDGRIQYHYTSYTATPMA